eukprot:TRINITY_DN9877_c0_g1_i1.p1 TRINITY_DN9877_c0_g1~~TRINITY_DN9877_c0_g1_i1.p1  ORF type:complete len:521 (+),score=119.09 TRINITY_DN9877_c0_g1_i1:41-1603(+)
MEKPAASPQNVVLQHAQSYCNKAKEFDRSGDFSAAIKSYEDGLRLFHAVLAKETNTEEKFQIELKIAEVESRIEELRAPKARPLPQPERAKSPGRGADDSLSFEVVVQIDKVNVFVLHQKEARVSINDGSFPVRILRGQQLNAQGAVEEIIVLQLAESTFFPLNQNIPCLRISPGHYVLPKEDSSFYGLRFPPNTPPAFLILFEDKLESYCCFRKEDIISVEEPSSSVVPAQQPSEGQLVVASDATLNPTVSKVVQGIEVGSSYIAAGVQQAGSLIKKGLEAGSSFIVSKIDKGSDDAKVPEALKKTVAVAKFVSPIAVRVSKTVVRGVSALAGAIGEEIGNVIHENMQKNGGGPKGEVATNAIAIGKAALLGASTIWDGLTDAGRTMIDGAQNASGTIVTHKLGDEAGQFVHDTFAVGKDIYELNAGLKSVGLKGLTKSVAKTAAKTVAQKAAASSSSPAAPVASALPVGIEGRSLVLQIADAPSAPLLERSPVIVDVGDEDFVLVDDSTPTPGYPRIV